MKYLGSRIDYKLNWKAHIDNIALKLIRADAMLYKVRDYVNAGIFKTIYHALFESHIHYACIIWGQCIHIQSALTLIHFKEHDAHTAPLFFKSKMVKLPDKIKIENCLFISKYVNNKLPPIFNSWFIFSSTSHHYETSLATRGPLKILTITTTTW